MKNASNKKKILMPYKHILFFVLFMIISYFQIYANEVNEQSIKNIILERIQNQEDVIKYDVNNDGKVNVGDVIKEMSPLEVFFAKSKSIVNEGQGIVDCEIIFTKSFSGKLYYELSGSAIPGVDFEEISSSVEVNGPRIKISITLIDDIELESTKVLLLSIKHSESKPYNYSLVHPNTHTIIIEDNDSKWKGHLLRNDLQLPFEINILKNQEQIQAFLISYGYGVFPKGPDGLWPISIKEAHQTFIAEIGPIEMNENSSLLNAKLIRKIKLISEPSEKSNHFFDFDSRIEGTMQEEWGFQDSNSKHLSRIGDKAINGTFILLKQNADFDGIQQSFVPMSNK